MQNPAAALKPLCNRLAVDGVTDGLAHFQFLQGVIAAAAGARRAARARLGSPELDNGAAGRGAQSSRGLLLE